MLPNASSVDLEAHESDLSKEVYAYGVLLISMISKEPVVNLPPTLPAKFVDPATRPLWLPQIVVDLVDACLATNPAERPSFKQICHKLKHV